MSELIQVGMSKRILARVIDILIFIVFAVVSNLVFQLDVSATNPTLFIFLAYNILLLLMVEQTIGKKICGIKLVSNSKDSIFFLQVIFREIIVFVVLYSSNIYHITRNYYDIPSFDIFIVTAVSIIIFLIDLSTVILGSSKRPLHDLLLNTNVVKANNKIRI